MKKIWDIIRTTIGAIVILGIYAPLFSELTLLATLFAILFIHDDERWDKFWYKYMCLFGLNVRAKIGRLFAFKSECADQHLSDMIEDCFG